MQGLDSLDAPPKSTNGPPIVTNGPPIVSNGATDVKEAPTDKSLQIFEDRKAPEGKDNDSMSDKELAEYKQGQTYTDVNGKVTVVHVVVTINGNGTLADLKKQRMQIRNSSSEVNSMSSPVNSISESENISAQPTNDIIKFSGETDEVSSYSKSKRCCVVM